MNSTLEEIHVNIGIGKPYNVVLYNDESHSTDEVTAQIIKAIHCTQSRAENIMLTAHKSGRAIVYTGHLEKAELVASILEEIRLSTKIEPC
jgi:ATP-dependent Clp protease adapter protein ClpS